VRRKLTLRVESELVQQAKALGINISRLTEEAISSSIGNRTYMHVQSDIQKGVQTRIQSTENGSRLGNAVQDVEGWRVGSNPPSVLGDIHLIGIPAPPAEVTGAYYPFHGVGWHFTLTASLLNAGVSSSLTSRGIFLRLDPTSRSTLRSVTLPPRGWSFLRPPRGDP